MKKLITLAILLCALPLATPAQDRMFGSGIDQKCYQLANEAAASLAQQGLSDDIVQKRFQQYLAECSGTNPLAAGFVGAINVDYFRLARLIISAKLQPDLYVGLVRDRARKMRLALKSSTWLSAYAQGDSDGDFIPNSMDRCAGTPDLTRTTDWGCTDPTPPAPQPSADDMQTVFNKMKLTSSPACDGAAFPGLSVPIKAGLTDNQRSEWAIAVTKVLGQPDKCIVLYEVQVHLSHPGGVLPPEDLITIVFRSTENKDLGQPGQDRQVFRVKQYDPGARGRLYDNAWLYNTSRFRVRAINGNGLSSGWSGWVEAPHGMFGEP